MMGEGVVELSWVDLVVSASLVIAAGIVSLAMRLQLETRIGIAAVRTVVQLLLIGYVLRWIFGLDSAWAVMGWLLFMTVVASRAAVDRSKRTFGGATLNAFVTLTACGFVTTFTVTGLVIGVEPWYRPQYVIPMLGMILGNGLTGISLCLDTILERFDLRRDIIEMELAHGATAWEAARDALREAVRTGMIPIINSMTVVGLVSLPGMMTGQILSGIDPFIAVQYQIVVMFMIAGATSLGCIGIALLAFRAVFNERVQLRTERIRRKS